MGSIEEGKNSVSFFSYIILRKKILFDKINYSESERKQLLLEMADRDVNCTHKPFGSTKYGYHL